MHTNAVSLCMGNRCLTHGDMAKDHSSLGYRTWATKDKSVNHHLVNLITFGEGWHNNHHNQPSNFIHGENNWWEWDLNAWIIRLIKN